MVTVRRETPAAWDLPCDVANLRASVAARWSMRRQSTTADGNSSRFFVAALAHVCGPIRNGAASVFRRPLLLSGVLLERVRDPNKADNAESLSTGNGPSFALQLAFSVTRCSKPLLVVFPVGRESLSSGSPTLFTSLWAA